MEQAVNDFWVATRAILDETPVNATLTENPNLSGREYETWDVTLSSYGGQRLRAHYTTPSTVQRRASSRRCWPCPATAAGRTSPTTS